MLYIYRIILVNLVNNLIIINILKLLLIKLWTTPITMHKESKNFEDILSEKFLPIYSIYITSLSKLIFYVKLDIIK